VTQAGTHESRSGGAGGKASVASDTASPRMSPLPRPRPYSPPTSYRSISMSFLLSRLRCRRADYHVTSLGPIAEYHVTSLARARHEGGGCPSGWGKRECSARSRGGGNRQESEQQKHTGAQTSCHCQPPAGDHTHLGCWGCAPPPIARCRKKSLVFSFCGGGLFVSHLGDSWSLTVNRTWIVDPQRPPGPVIYPTV
jgi:hypothetical protein